MKNITKKLLAIFLMVVMTIGMGVTAFAATPQNNVITVPVTIVIDALPSNYTGNYEVGQIYHKNVSIDLNNNSNPTAMDFIKATRFGIHASGDYITGIKDIYNYDEEYTSNHYKGYSWMIDLKAGSSVTTTGTKPAWATLPVAGNNFESPLAATNVYMNGTQFFPYTYGDNSNGFSTSVEGITLRYSLVEMSW
ncbi:hypothetical protein P261_01288 [Lachnospiraceae bacterium TWA4]|nr:hypothetical protein P261_01288 [Lachnospiraceae bacterium TWA4]